MNNLQYPIVIPPHVQAARAAAPRVGFGLVAGEGDNGTACLTEFGPMLAVLAVLAVLAAMKPAARIAELGTGVGVGTAWLLSGMTPGSTIATVEIDAQRAAIAAELFADQSSIDVIVGDWRDVLPEIAPFDLVFLDGGYAAELDENRRTCLIDLVAIGGVLILDDVTPEKYWPKAWQGQREKREFALRDDRLLSSEFRLTNREGGLLCVRIR